MAALPGGGDAGNVKNQILELGVVLLKDFIFQRIQRNQDCDHVTREQLGVQELRDPNLKELSQCIQRIGNELDNREDLQRLINKCLLTPQEFMTVANYTFSDGKISWGRVVALFYFACRLVIKALLAAVEIIGNIIQWTMDYIREHVVNWIREQGGWEGVPAYFGTPMWQMVGVFLAGFLTAVIVKRGGREVGGDRENF